MNRDLTEFSGDENSKDLLTAISGKPRTRGRPSKFTDQQLWSARDQYVQRIEWAWGDIGWELPRAKSVTQVQQIFRVINNENAPFSIADCLTRTAFTRPVKASELRRISREISRTWDAYRAAWQYEELYRARLERIAIAVSQCKTPQQSEFVEHEKTTRKEQFESAKRKSELIRSNAEVLRADLQAKEARFAQDQVLAFISSERYTFTPVNLANALAGLPFVGWRQSAKRCVPEPCGCANLAAFKTFKLIAAAIKSGRSERKALAVGVHDYLLRTKKTGYEVEELRKNWYYLQEVIMGCQQETFHPKSLAFKITTQYHKRIMYQSALDLMLQEDMQI